jgi:hypothetical protein
MYTACLNNRERKKDQDKKEERRERKGGKRRRNRSHHQITSENRTNHALLLCSSFCSKFLKNSFLLFFRPHCSVYLCFGKRVIKNKQHTCLRKWT